MSVGPSSSVASLAFLGGKTLTDSFRCDSQAGTFWGASGVGWKGMPLVETPQIIRASLFATAMAARFRPRLLSTSRAHSCNRCGAFVRCAESSTDLAPLIKSVLKYVSPLLLIDPSRRLSPLECSFGVRPSELAKRRPVPNREKSPTIAANAVAFKAPLQESSRGVRPSAPSRLWIRAAF